MAHDRKVAVLTAVGFDEAHVLIVQAEATRSGLLVSLAHPARTRTPGERQVHVSLAEASEENYAALVVPGGIVHCDALRDDAMAVEFVGAFIEAEKPVIMIGHAVWLLVESGHARGLRLSAPRSIRTDLDHAGAIWTGTPWTLDGRVGSCAGADGIASAVREVVASAAAA
ncbi:MAG: DJ-1/PfpI family protein [Terrimicrobiaceae bacterium]|nr:DJ-1/PfpI family protein [Terrimicrobiaceae bacterium]